MADEKKTKKVKRAAGIYVAEGCAITTKKGVKGPGELISAEILAGEKKALDALIEKDLVEVVK